ncbi:hypothetical protein AAHZ94_03180 [Streptomyces sp. HSW2009]|uniref:hypothetical protein n=1 Tax=Streptomyces sp. HSW2009 TaxID=3142890 RepID=UPI0032F0867F
MSTVPSPPIAPRRAVYAITMPSAPSAHGSSLPGGARVPTCMSWAGRAGKGTPLSGLDSELAGRAFEDGPRRADHVAREAS